MQNQILKIVKSQVFIERSWVFQLIDISDEAVNINIAAPPRDGEANEELIQYLSGVLEIKKT